MISFSFILYLFVLELFYLLMYVIFISTMILFAFLADTHLGMLISRIYRPVMVAIGDDGTDGP
jgi:hypothetical protein